MFFTHRTAEFTTPHRIGLIRNVFNAQALHSGHHPAPAPIFRVSDRLHAERSVTVAAHEIAATVAAWLAELGVHSPLVEQLDSAVFKGDWMTARAIADHLSVDVTSTL
jgi:hypothetical protein